MQNFVRAPLPEIGWYDYLFDRSAADIYMAVEVPRGTPDHVETHMRAQAGLAHVSCRFLAIQTIVFASLYFKHGSIEPGAILSAKAGTFEYQITEVTLVIFNMIIIANAMGRFFRR